MKSKKKSAVAAGLVLGLLAWSVAQGQEAGVVAHGSTPTHVAIRDNGRIDVTPAAVRDGVSYNGFERFNVGAAGLAFRNEDVKARTIVAEVLSASPSRIEGALEVLGPRANLILANQNGIRVNGGSFVNFGGVALTTGQVALRDQLQASGYVRRYVDVDTRQGGITVGPQGLSGNLIRLEMIAKTIGIEGAVANTYSSSSATVRMVAGQSLAQFDTAASPVDNLTPWVHYTAGEASSTAAALSLDAGSSVTSGRIEVLITDQGAGVRNAGHMVAAAGDFKLSSTGVLEQAGGRIQALGRVQMELAHLEQSNTAQAIGLIAAGTSTTIDATGDIRNRGGEISGQSRHDDAQPYAVMLNAGGVIENATPLGAPQPAVIFGYGDSVGLFAGQGIVSTNGRVISNAGIVAKTQGDLRHESLHEAGAGKDDWKTSSLLTRRSGYRVDMGDLADAANQAYWVSQGDLDVTARNVENIGGFMFSNAGSVRIAALGDVVNRAHSIGAFEYRQKCFLFICHRTASSTEALTGGQIMAASEVDIQAGMRILNDAGQIHAGTGMRLQAEETIARGRPVRTVILRDKGLKALLGDTWAKVYAADQGGSFTVQSGRMILQGAARQEAGLFQASEGIDGAIDVLRLPGRDPVRLENHLGLLWW